MATASIGVREKMAAASKRIARVKLLDRAATGVISFGGVFIIVSVLFIFVFIFAEALPLFRGATADRARHAVAAAARCGRRPRPAARASGVDEYQRYLYEVTCRRAAIAFFRVQDGSPHRELPVPGLGGATVTAASPQPAGRPRGARHGDGRVALLQVRFRPVFEDQVLQDLELELRDRGLRRPRPAEAAGPRRQLPGVAGGARRTVAALLADDEIALARVDGRPPTARRRAGAAIETLRTRPGDAVIHVRLGRSESLVAATRQRHRSTTGTSSRRHGAR